jgi:hypothetical protein
MTLTLEIAKDIWSSEDGYRRINHSFCNTYKQGIFIRGNKDQIKFYDETGEEHIFYVKDVIEILKQGMKTANSVLTYYRGENVPLCSYKKEGFMSFTEEIDIAIPFMENACCLFEAILDKDVKRLKMGGEREVLVENGCFWEHTGRSKRRNVDGEDYEVFTVKIHSPSSNYSYPAFGDLTAKRLGDLPKKTEHTQIPHTPQMDFDEMTEEEWEELNGFNGGKNRKVNSKLIFSKIKSTKSRSEKTATLPPRVGKTKKRTTIKTNKRRTKTKNVFSKNYWNLLLTRKYKKN